MATIDGQTVYGKYGVPARATMSITNLDVNKFDLVLLPGGFEAPDRIRFLPEVQSFIQKMDEEKKLIAEVLNKTNWNRRKASELLEISYRSLLYKIKEYRLNETA